MVQNMHHDVANTETMLVARSHSITVSKANIHCLKEGESFGGVGGTVFGSLSFSQLICTVVYDSECMSAPCAWLRTGRAGGSLRELTSIQS